MNVNIDTSSMSSASPSPSRLRDVRKRKAYTGRSRTTRWRRRKCGLEWSDSSSDSADEIGEVVWSNRFSIAGTNSDKQMPTANAEKANEGSDKSVTQAVSDQEGTTYPALLKDIGPEIMASYDEIPLPVSDGTQLDAPVITAISSKGASTPMSKEEDTDSDTIRSSSSGSLYHPSPACSESGDLAEFSSDLECFEAYYLEEGPEAAEPNLQPEHDQEDGENLIDDAVMPVHQGDPDDPDDPDAQPPDASDSEDSAGEDEEEVATFHNEALNVNVQLLQNRTRGQVLAMVLASAVRHKMTFENIIDHFKILNVLFGPRVFPESKTKLWSVILLNKSGIRFHVYCGRQACNRYLGRRNRFVNFVECVCGYRVPVGKARFFITLDLKTQLKYFLGMPGIWEKLQYPQTRQKRSPTGIEDVMDGSRYRTLRQEGGPLANGQNFSFFFNLDACKISKKGSLKLLPVYIRVNELPPELRQKFFFPVAVYCDHYEPNYAGFMKPLVKQFRRLAVNGVDWKPDGVNEINSKFYCLGFNVDSPVRYAILNMTKWDSVYGCTYCTHQGIRVAGSTRYPELHLEGIPAFLDRTHEGMIAAMIRLHEEPDLLGFEGHRGASHLMLLPHLDLRDGQAHDDLHQDHEGCAKDLTQLLLSTPEARVNDRLPQATLLRRIDERLMRIKTPARISRKPRSISDYTKYSGTEWRNWLFYYAIPCLLGLIKPEYLDILASLSHACYLLSKDVIENEDLNIANELLISVSHRFENIFGVGRMKYNLHLTTKHKVNSVRTLGNPCMYSTYNFESLHRRMTGRVTSPKGALTQVLTRSMLHMVTMASQYDQRLPEDVRLHITETLNPYQLQGIREIAPHTYLVGHGNPRATTEEEAAAFQEQGINVINIIEYKSCVLGSNRFKSLAGQNQNSKSDDTFLCTRQGAFCTIRSICAITEDDGDEMYGMFVTVFDIIQALPVANHLYVLENGEHAPLCFITLTEVHNPAIRIHIGHLVYAVMIPNSFEID